MRRLEVSFRPHAVSDLEDIFRAVIWVSQNRITAERFVARILARCRRIGDAPYGGRPREDLQPGLRTVPFEKTAVIAYLVFDHVEIVNVFYGGRDYEALYLAREPSPSDNSA